MKNRLMVVRQKEEPGMLFNLFSQTNKTNKIGFLNQFVDKYTVFKDYKEFIVKAEDSTKEELWKLKNFVEKKYVKDSEFNDFIKNNTKFKDFQKMFDSWINLYEEKI